MDHRPQVEIVSANASPEEAAAVVAALEQFLRDHAVAPPRDAGAERSPWLTAAIREGVNRAPDHPPFWT